MNSAGLKKMPMGLIHLTGRTCQPPTRDRQMHSNQKRSGKLWTAVCQQSAPTTFHSHKLSAHPSRQTTQSVVHGQHNYCCYRHGRGILPRDRLVNNAMRSRLCKYDVTRDFSLIRLFLSGCFTRRLFNTDNFWAMSGLGGGGMRSTECHFSIKLIICMIN